MRRIEILDIKYKDKLQHLTKMNNNNWKGELNEQQSYVHSSLNQTKELVNKKDDTTQFMILQEVNGYIEDVSSMKSAHKTKMSKTGEEVKITTAILRKETTNSVKQKRLLVVIDKDKGLDKMNQDIRRR